MSHESHPSQQLADCATSLYFTYIRNISRPTAYDNRSCHHASNEKYLDKNYGDVFIIWDKLFGTFQKEEDGVPIQYGLTCPLKSYSFLWQHFHFIAELFLAARKTTGFVNKVNLIFGKPDLIDHRFREQAEEKLLVRKNDIPAEARKPSYGGSTPPVTAVFHMASNHSYIQRAVFLHCPSLLFAHKKSSLAGEHV